MVDVVVCHYHEIGLKGKNRDFFERKLVENIKKAVAPEFFEWVKKFPGRIVISLTEKGSKNLPKIKKSLNYVFGISYFAFALSCSPQVSEIKKSALGFIKIKKGKTFKIETKRSNKKFPYSSQKINEIVGEYVLKHLKGKKVKLENPKITCFIEILPKIAFLYTEKIKGLGGLPVTTAGKVVSLLSGGIDSPVASFLLQKRGAKVVFVHFHAYPYTNKASIEKAKEIVEILNKYQFGSKLYLVPFAEIQKEILLKTQAKFRVILYRRAMFKIAQFIAKKENAKGLVSGESLGQVASQTLENILAIDEAVSLPVFRPLVGMNKEEIINLAKEIGTYDISILPHEDCCARFIPKHPETKADLKKIKQEEKKFNLRNLIQKTQKRVEIVVFK
ncbi:MAG: tRNA 4-thiouridine(8) synthase ThiI [Candidatus Pacebacteria bacterium]|nr:tRNA 4-thiouridine(8) synthase ThiI [Candidatus Paceibacterota bacterium]